MLPNPLVILWILFILDTTESKKFDQLVGGTIAEYMYIQYVLYIHLGKLF